MASPLLVLPLDQEDSGENNLVLFNPKHKKTYKVNGLKNLLKNHQCVGSSHGWLGLLDENSNPYLFNPFSNTRIHLPEKQTLPHYVRHIPQKDLGPLSGSYVSKIDKIVLSRNPSHDHKSYVVVVMYSVLCQTKIAFCRDGDQQWSHLESEVDTCYDVVCCDKTNTVLALGPGPIVESWDFKELVPKKKMIIQDSCPRKLTRARRIYPNDLYASNWYLVLSSLGQIFLVVRYIGEFVRYDGEVVYEGDTLTDYASEPLVCPYKTVDFHVFKVDFDRKEWIEVKCLDGFSMFLGRNQSIMVSTKEHQELKRNCIYFTDDYSDRMNEDYSYGGHDMGIFKMEDGSVEPILECQEQRIEPPPFWITVPREYIFF